MDETILPDESQDDHFPMVGSWFRVAQPLVPLVVQGLPFLTKIYTVLFLLYVMIYLE